MSHPKAVMGQSRKEDSNKNIQCGICDPPYFARRDWLKSNHFPAKHPGQPYREKGERTLSFGVRGCVAPPSPLLGQPVSALDLHDTEGIHDDETMEPADTQEVLMDPPKIGVSNEDLMNLIVEMQKTLGTPAKTVVSNDDLMEATMKMQKMMEDQIKVPVLAGQGGETNVDEMLLIIQGSKSINELCTKAGFTAFESENKVICDVCTHDDLTDETARRLGEFQYDQFKHGDDFTNRSEPREFRNLKTVVVKHFKSQYHMKMNNDLVEKHKQDEKNEKYNHKVGMGRARQIYQNVKNKCSFEK